MTAGHLSKGRWTWISTALAALALAGLPHGARAQPQLNPVYVDDSPAATETLARVKDHLGAGNIDEAVRVLQMLLDEHADRLVASARDADVFVSVRARVHQVLMENKPLLDRYRAVEGPRAAAVMDSAPNQLRGPVDVVQRSMLLTSAGLEAGLRVAQRQVEDARFEAARITLDELESHPDRLAGGKPAEDAAALLAQVARHLDRPDLWAQAERWGKPGLDRTAAPPPGAAVKPGLTTLGPLPPLDVKGLIATPLFKIDIKAPIPLDLNQPLGGPGGVRGGAPVPVAARDLSMLPTITDDLVLINDGAFVTAWDRFTLSARWTVQPSPGAPAAGPDEPENNWRGGRMTWGTGGGPEPATVTVAGPYAAASTGRSPGGGRDADDRVHGIDPRTGRVRWSVTLADLDPMLADNSVRGPVEIFEGVVVVAVHKHAPDRRLTSASLLGLSAETGRLLWLRPLGSAGWLPYGAQTSSPEATVIDRGVAYRTDALGAAAAVEVESGRVRWVRRMPVEAGAGKNDTPQPWEVNRPVVDGGSIVVIAPDGRRLVRLESATGAVLAERQANQFGSPPPSYLLRVGQQLAAVAINRIALTPLVAFDSAPVRLTPGIEDPGIRGRVSAVGDKLLIPLVRGLALVDPRAPDAEPLVQPLDRPGNVLAVGSQLLVLDDNAAHSYLQWDVAEALLRDRIAADPADPTPAVTFAELAYRAGKFDRIPGSVDGALAAIGRDPASERSGAQKARLFEALHTVIGAGLDAVERAATIHQPEPDGAPRLTDRAQLAVLIERLALATGSPDDRVAVALASGRLGELNGEAAKAAGVYQRILDDPAMATANWRGPSVSVRAELEAARRLEQLIALNGPMIYAGQEAESQKRLAELGESATVEQLEQLAARYPLATGTPELFRRISETHKQAGRPRESVAALETGLKAAQRIPSAPGATVGELAGRLVIELRERQQPGAAAAVLRTVRKRLPELALTASGQALDAVKLGAELAERLAAITRWPRVGQLTGENIQAIAGWTLLKPDLRELSPHVSRCMVMQSDREVGVWTVETQGPGAGRMGKRWSRRIEDMGVSLIRTTPDAVYILLTSGLTGGIEKVPLNDSVKGWTTDPITKLFPPGADSRGLQPVAGVMQTFETPDDGPVPPDDLLVVMDERTLALVQRGGRVVALDSDSGEVLWRADTGVSQVYDAQLAAGTLVVAGEVRKTNAAGALEDLSSAAQLVDARSGRLGERVRDFRPRPEQGSSRLRWVRITEAGHLICGTENAVVSLDLSTMQRNWTLTGGEMLPASAAWIFGDRLLLLSTDRQLWLASLSTGRVRGQSLEAPRSRLDSSREIDAFTTTPNADGPFAVTTYQGIMIFSPEGDLQGIDGLGAIDAMLPPRPAEDRAIAIQTVSDGRAESGLLQFQVYSLESASAMLVHRQLLQLPARPQAAELIDGKVAISAGSGTIILEAPAGR